MRSDPARAVILRKRRGGRRGAGLRPTTKPALAFHKVRCGRRPEPDCRPRSGNLRRRMASHKGSAALRQASAAAAAGVRMMAETEGLARRAKILSQINSPTESECSCCRLLM